MSLVEIILLVVKASIFLSVLAFALNAELADATYLFRHPTLLLRAVLSMNVVMVVIAVVLAATFNLHPATKVALVALALSPVPPIMPKKAFKAGGTGSYVIGLLVAAALLSIVLVPLSLELLQRILGIPLGMSPVAVAAVVLTTIIMPLGLGIALHSFAPAKAEEFSKPVSIVAAVLLLAGLIPMLIAAGPAMWSLIGSGAIVALAAFVILGLLTGHVFGGPDPEDRSVLALATSARHPGLAVAIAHANFPQQKLVLGAVVLYILVGAIVTIPYMKWRKRNESGREIAAA